MSEVKVGDTVRANDYCHGFTKGNIYEVRKVDSNGDTKLRNDFGVDGYMHPTRYTVTPETDLTQNTTALGLMSEVDQERMQALPVEDVLVYDLDHMGEYSFVLAPMRHLISTGIYRQRPAPTRVSIADLKGTVALDADGKPDFSTYEDEQ